MTRYAFPAGLEPVQEINRPLGVGGGLEDGALVLLQDASASGRDRRRGRRVAPA